MIDLGTTEFVDLAEIGRGGFGVVYTAHQPSFDRKVAIKVLTLADAGTLRRFDRERQALGKVSNHPHITPVFASGFTADGMPYLAMEFMAGGSLSDWVAAEGAMGWKDVLDLGVKMAGALETAHRAGILHRDLKPANILLSGFGEPRLADFGIASVDGGEQTKTGSITASVAYAAPEVLDGRRPDVAADIYSLCATLFTLVAGFPPFQIEGEQSILAMVVRIAGDPVPDLRPKGIPDAMAAVLEKGMAKQESERYASAEVLGLALSAVQRELGVPTTKMVLPLPGNEQPTSTESEGPTVAHSSGLPWPAPAVPGQPPAVQEPPAASAPPPAPTPPPVPTPDASSSPAPTPAPGPSAVPRGQAPEESPAKSSRAPVIAGVVGVLAVLVVGGFFLTRGGGGSEAPGPVPAATVDASAAPSDVVESPAETAEPALEVTEEVPSGESGLVAGAWQEVRPMRIARQQVPSVELRGTVWLTGGLVDDGVTATVEGYEVPTNSWRAGPDMPIPLHHHMSAVYDDQIVVLGGWSPDGALLSAITSDRVFSLNGSEWQELPPLLQPRVAGTAQAVGGLLIVTGGQDQDGQLVSTTEVFDGEAWTEVAPIPTPREHLASTTDGEFLYVVGGRELSSDANLGTLERYDPATDEWVSLADMPTPRGGLAAVMAEGVIVALGGERPLGVFDNVETYDVASDSWEELPPLTVARHGLAASVSSSLVIAAGGALEATHSSPTPVTEVVSLR